MRKVIGSSPISSTKHKKSELLPIGSKFGFFYCLFFRYNSGRRCVGYKKHAVIKHRRRLEHSVAGREEPHDDGIALTQISQIGTFGNLSAQLRAFRHF